MSSLPTRTLDFDKDLAKFTPRQMDAVEALDQDVTKFLLYGGALGGGKALALDTDILTISGWKTIGTIAVGDIVFDEKGWPCNVLGVTEVMHDRQCFRVTFSDGSEIVADAQHEWLTYDVAERQALLRRTPEFRAKRRAVRGGRGTGKRPDLAKRNRKHRPETKPAPLGSIRTTAQIAATLRCGETNNHAVPVCGQLRQPEAALPIDPYVLGAWLGDGVGVSGIICDYEGEVFAELQRRGYPLGRGAERGPRTVLGIKGLLRDLDLLGNKHIPRIYLQGNQEQRLDLLRGLMDTDGHACKSGACEFTTTNSLLADGFFELVCSLGIKTTIRTGRATLNGKDCGEKYRIKFTTTVPVFSMKRKVAAQAKEVRATQGFRMIVGCEQIDSVPVRCIQVDSPSHLYLAGRALIPTHNSYFLRWWSVRRLIELAEMGHRNVTGMLACEDYPSLKDRQLQKIGREVPQWMGRVHQDHREYGRCLILTPQYGGNILCFRNLDDSAKYASAEFAFICVDELTKNDYDTFTFLRTRLRWPGLKDHETKFVGATNPGSVGHNWCKQLFIDRVYPKEFLEPKDYSDNFVYIPSKADDNPFIDESYWAMLHTLPEQIRRAFRDGDWDIFVGQAFSFAKTTHVVEPRNIPPGAQIYMTFDWGYGAPFSVGWWWVDGEGRLWRFGEWYGWCGQPNQGLRLTDEQIAEGIVHRERQFKKMYKGEFANVMRIAGPDCFSKKPDYRGGGQGPSTAEVFATPGMSGGDPHRAALYLTPGDPDRANKIRAFRNRLVVPKDGTLPMLVVYDTCDQFIRTVPNLVVDKRNIEDVDTGGEDHIYDEACHICQARPIVTTEQMQYEFSEANRDWQKITGIINPRTVQSYAPEYIR